MYTHKKIVLFIFSFLLISSVANADMDIDSIVNDAVNNVSTTSVWTSSSFSWTYTWDVSLDMFSEITWDIIVDGWNLTLWTNVDVLEHNIILKNAKKVVLWVNSDVKSIKWNAESFETSTNSNVWELSVDVSWDTVFSVNSTIEKIYLKTANLEMSTNTDVNEWIIYVYKSFDWWVNTDFKWKLTVYWDSSVWVNGDVNWRFCSLWKKVDLWVNADLVTYSMDGLLWNVDPILNVNTTDSSEEFNEVRKISLVFDKKLSDAFDSISSYNAEISSLKSSLSKAKDSEKSWIQSQIDSKVSSKNAVKEETKKYISETFDKVLPYIDTNKNNISLFNNVENIYTYAVEYEDEGQIYNVCNNSEVNWSVNSVYEKWWKIYFWTKSFARKTVISDSDITSLSTMMTKIPEDKLAKVTSKIDTMTESIAESKSKSTENNVNLLLDVKELLRNEMLYWE